MKLVLRFLALVILGLWAWPFVATGIPSLIFLFTDPHASASQHPLPPSSHLRIDPHVSAEDGMEAVRFVADIAAGAKLDRRALEPFRTHRSNVDLDAVDLDWAEGFSGEPLGRAVKKGEVLRWSDLDRLPWMTLDRVALSKTAGPEATWEEPLGDLPSATERTKVVVELLRQAGPPDAAELPFDLLVRSAACWRWLGALAEIGAAIPGLDAPACLALAKSSLTAALDLEPRLLRELRIAGARDRSVDAARLGAMLRRLFPLDPLGARPWQRTGMPRRARACLRAADEASQWRSPGVSPFDPLPPVNWSEGEPFESVLVVRRPISTGDFIGYDDVQSYWAPRSATPDGALSDNEFKRRFGSCVRRDLLPGTVLLETDLALP